MLLMRGREAGALVTEARRNREAIEQLREELASHRQQHDRDRDRAVVTRRWYLRMALMLAGIAVTMTGVAVTVFVNVR